VAIKYFFIRDTVRDKLVKISHVNTEENEADILTKNTSTTSSVPSAEDDEHACAKLF
jgi:hypothetical protein